MFLEKRWLNCTARNAWTRTTRNRRVTTTRMERTLERGSLTCCSWCTQNTDPNEVPTSLYHDYLDSRYIQWHTKSKHRQLPTPVAAVHRRDHGQSKPATTSEDRPLL